MNDEVDDINEAVLAKFPGNAHTLLGADSVQTQDKAVNDYQPGSALPHSFSIQLLPVDCHLQNLL